MSLIFVVVVAVSLAYGPVVFAQGTGTETSPLRIAFVPDFLLDIFSRILLLITRFFLSLSMFLLSFIIEIGSYNGYLSSSAVTIGWVTVRDITNMGFVVILLVIAFGTILGLEQYEWKKLLVKFVLAAVLVNFSRIICGIIIDVAQVVMTTFVNGIAATAGGNLINAFDLTGIQKLSAEGSQFNADGRFIASVAAITFSAMVMAIMAVFLVMLLARMVVLWVLIVLSPLAFVLSVVPQTQKYASEWWSEFGANVVTGPVLLFFLWLSFVTVGGGNAHQQIADKSGYKLNEADATKAAGTEMSSGITEAMKWNSMANFAIAIGMLIVGAKTAQQLGGVGAAWAGGAIDFGKKVATVASGVAAARWAGGKVKEGAIAGAKGIGKGLYTATIENTVERVKMWGQRQVEGYRSWRAQGPRLKRTEMAKGEELTEEEKARGVTVKEEEIDGVRRRFKYDFERELKRTKMKEGEELTEAEKLRGVKMVEEGGERFKEEMALVDTRGWAQKQLHERQERLVRSKKLLTKVTKQKEVREELMDKRVTADPSYFMQRFEGEKGVYRFNALDRMEQGQLAAEKARSEAKTKEFAGLGKGVVLANERFKDQAWQGKRGSIAKQIAEHEGTAHGIEAEVARLQQEETAKFFGSHAGHEIEVRTNLAEQAKKAAEDFVKTLKDENLRDAFKKAAEAVEAVMDKIKNDPAKVQEEVNKIAAVNPFVAALANAQELGEVSREKGIREKQAQDSAHDAVVGLAQGSRTQSTALSEEMERVKKEYSSLERTQAEKLAADRIAYLMEKMSKQNGKLELRDNIALNAAISAVDMEAWNDDVIDHIFDMINSKDKFKEGSIEHQQASGFEKLQKQMGWEIAVDPTDGKKKIKTAYGRDMSSQLQNLASFGGDTTALQAHAKVEKVMERNPNLSYEEGIYEALGAEADQYLEKLRRAQDFLQTAARVYTQDAYGNTHYESAHNQQFDTRLQGGMLRPMTRAEAERETIVDLGKKKQPELAGAQIHSVIEMDLNSHLPQRVLESMYRAVFGQMNEEYQWNGVNQRTARKLYGYDLGEDIQKREGNAVIGGKQIAKTFGAGAVGSQDRGVHIIKDYLLPQLLGSTKSFYYGLKQTFNHISTDEANKGVLKIDIDGFGAVTGLADLKELITKNSRLRSQVSDEDIARLDKLIADASGNMGLGLARRGGGGGRGGGGTPAEERG